MVGKIYSMGNSYGVSIPKKILKKLHLTAGTQVKVKLDEESNNIIIEPAIRKSQYEAVDIEFASQVKDFIKRYKPALKALAKDELSNP
ncbi:MAG TPA: AbrB/MazE/SpoVT family DNA-binding domain-containing protein [Candidatus Brocadiia bacterium]|nr:AbrB/MazE/SpoVT family DNA-binding domain-containing protein [Candidatus Brocadiales bacterium]